MVTPYKKFLWFLFLVALAAEGYLGYWIKETAPGGLLAWVETDTPAKWYRADTQDPPTRLPVDDKQYLVQAVADAHVLSNVEGEFNRIAALRQWTRESCPEISMYPHNNDASDILDAYEAGNGGACGSLATLYCAALVSHGYRARIVQLIRDRWDVEHWNDGPLDTHVTVEVYSPEKGKWFVSDPTFNCWFHAAENMAPMSAREIQDLVTNNTVNFSQTGWVPLGRAGEIVAEYGDVHTLPTIDSYYIDPTLLYANIFLLYYDIYAKRPEDPFRKYSYLSQARILGTEKIVWIQPSGSATSQILLKQRMFNYIPIGLIVLLILIMIPAGAVVQDDDEVDEEEE
ncbi:MAG TPA: transglutaminase-like domain-containing protein [bacterium]|jgi:hypothetical protein